MSMNTTNNTLNDLSPTNQRSSSVYKTDDENLGLKNKNSSNQRNFSKKVSFPDNDYTQADQYDQSPDQSPDQSFASVTTTTSSIVNNKLLKRKIVR